MGHGWQHPAGKPGIAFGELHLWRARLSSGSPAEDVHLAEDERLRMHRFHSDYDRKMFLLAHGLLRRLLGGYLDLPAEQIEFGYTKYDKPYLAFKEEQGQLEFNLSHSGDVVLIAVARGAPVGVDVEEIRPLPDLEQIATQYFTPGEQRDLNFLSGPEKEAAFYRCWTRKEAVIKACGEGLSMPLDSFQVSLLPGEPARLLHSPDERAWMLLDVGPGPGYAAAAAAPAESMRVNYFSVEGI